MNKTEKIISILLGAVLAWYLVSESSKANARAKAAAEQAAIAATNSTASAEATRPAEDVAAEAPAARPAPSFLPPGEPERIVALENGDAKVELSSWGAAVKKATLKRYARERGNVSDANPPVELDFSSDPLGAAGALGLGAVQLESFDVVEATSNRVVFARGAKKRVVRIEEGYRIVFEDEGFGGGISLGTMRMGDSKNDLLSVDSWDLGREKPGVVHHCEGDSPLKPYLVGGLSGGCSGCSGTSSSAFTGDSETVEYAREQSWVALKNRFFVSAFVSSTARNAGFRATVKRDVKSSSYRPESVSAAVVLADAPAGAARTTVFYVGPKKQSLLWDLGMKDVMEFGMWRWLCYPLVSVLNFFNSLIPNYGIAIILLTILVRLIFWPLTHKSTVGMRKMQELQPKLKEIQAKFKDNPQRLQQETWGLYKSAKVNPMSSCLPMIVQIPVFIALFNVLRSAVELRYAPFLWIGDLSEPEGLFAEYLPFGGLNILPILMALSTGLQSAFTPSTGDKSQQRMMMIFMPIMMLVMFYSFPSALSLYWFLSNLFSIVQMWIIRRSVANEGGSGGALVPEVIDPPTPTRQMRRHG